jgi:hypothetical protein
MKDQIKNILKVTPGDSIDIFFPGGMEIKFERRFWKDDEPAISIFTSSVSRMCAYYWDEDDHCILDLYFYENDKDLYWVAKWWDLTEESQKKVLEFIQKNHK